MRGRRDPLAICTPTPRLPKITSLESVASWSAEVVEWQTQRTQNPPWATTCGFKSRSRHHNSPRQCCDFQPADDFTLSAQHPKAFACRPYKRSVWKEG